MINFQINAEKNNNAANYNERYNIPTVLAMFM